MILFFSSSDYMYDLWSGDWSNAEVANGDIYKMVTPQLIKSTASHAEIVFIISQSNETSSVVHDINIAQNYSEPYNNWDKPKSELWKYICRVLKINNIILRNAIENHFVIVLQSVDPNLVGAPPKTVSLAGGEGWGLGMKKGLKASVRVSLHLESRSRKALAKQYLFCGSVCFQLFFTFFCLHQ